MISDDTDLHVPSKAVGRRNPNGMVSLPTVRSEARVPSVRNTLFFVKERCHYDCPHFGECGALLPEPAGWSTWAEALSHGNLAKRVDQLKGI
jgi:hypothetical protein